MIELIDAGGVRTRVVRRGAGSPLVLIHGFTGSSDAMAELAGLLAVRHEVIAYDVVGHGGTEIPSTAAGASMQAAVDQLFGVVGEGPAHVVGYSMGGRVALCAIPKAAGRFSSVSVIGSHPGIVDAAERADRRRADDRMADAIEARGIEWFVDQWMAAPIFASQRRLGPAARAVARDRRLRNDPTGLANSMRGMGTGVQTPVWDELAVTSIPLLYLAGQEDPKFAEIGTRLASTVPGATFVEVPDVGHAAHEEDPGRVAELILEHTARSEG